LKSIATLSLSMAGHEERAGLDAVLSPDNKELPRGLSLTSRGEGKALELSVESDSSSTCISTALALLNDIALFQEVWLLSRQPDGWVRRK
jgi:hypothetical protein